MRANREQHTGMVGESVMVMKSTKEAKLTKAAMKGKMEGGTSSSAGAALSASTEIRRHRAIVQGGKVCTTSDGEKKQPKRAETCRTLESTFISSDNSYGNCF